MQVGKAYFELVDYLEADHYFELAHRLSPCILDGMDIYSTVLYVSEVIAVGLLATLTFIYKLACFCYFLQHLNVEMRLSYLAQELISIDRLSPQAWYAFVLLCKEQKCCIIFLS
jgi:anaphase-promoting complex subunit 3